ncbi:InlB B-repeat-containing protein [Candidatus Magnetominusculus xianensis]|nr:hypothetical protein [Candidatus Magnetominusculus xianensis]MBF0404709.1 fibronectin type III domain-containing protein [Nitrospirota bacterium]
MTWKSISYTLTVTKSGSGTVTSSPTGMSCGSTVSSYDIYTSVTLTATADAGYTFSNWTGCDSLNGAQCTVTMFSNKSVTAVFTNICTVTSSAGVGGTISPSIQTTSCGNTAAFTVTPNTGYTASVNSTCGGYLSGSTFTTGTLTSDCAVSATFTQSTSKLPPTISEDVKSRDITSTSAVVTGKVNPKNSLTTVYALYGTDMGSLISKSSQTTLTGVGQQEVSFTLESLSPNTTYYFKLAAENASGKVESKVFSLTTPKD